jgi:hypothetical protein
MADFDLPQELYPQVASFGLQKAGLQWQSPHNGTLQAIDFVAERWMLDLQLPPRVKAKAGLAEAFFNRLAGGVNRLRMHHPTRLAPAGTMRGSPTLKTTVNRGASSLVLQGVRNHNLLVSSSFEIDANANGIADGWTAYSNGTVVGGSYGFGASFPAHGALEQMINATSVGSTTADRLGMYQLVDLGAGVSYSGPVTMALSVRGTPSGMHVVLYCEAIDATPAIIGSAVVVDATTIPSSPMQRISGVFTAPAGTRSLRYYVWVSQSPGGAIALRIDAALMALGNVSTAYPGPATLKAGDLIGCGGHLFQVAEDCTASDIGEMTVPLVNRVRSTITAGAAVTWDKPTAYFVAPAMRADAVHRPGYIEGMTVNLMETWT